MTGGSPRPKIRSLTPGRPPERMVFYSQSGHGLHHAAATGSPESPRMLFTNQNCPLQFDPARPPECMVFCSQSGHGLHHAAVTGSSDPLLTKIDPLLIPIDPLCPLIDPLLIPYIDPPLIPH